MTYGFHMVFFIYGPTLQLTLRTYILRWVNTTKTVFGHWTRFRCRKLRKPLPFILLYFLLKILSICCASLDISSLKIHLLSWRPTFRVKMFALNFDVQFLLFSSRHDWRCSNWILKHLDFDDHIETRSEQHHFIV